MQGVPPGLRKRAFRVVSAKAALMARVDAARSSPTGQAGRDMRDEIRAKTDKWQEAPPARINQALPAPIEKKSKRRGGRRVRNRKASHAVTEMAKAQNRLAFGKQEQEVIDGDEMVGMGMLGQDGNKRLRIVAQASKLGKKLEERKKHGKYKGPTFTNAPGAGSGAQTNGLSSIAFTPVQGIELANPGQLTGAGFRNHGEESGYFSTVGSFTHVGKGGGGIMLPPGGGTKKPAPRK